MIDLNTELTIDKIIMALISEIDGNSIHIVMTSISQDTIVQFQIVALGS